MKSRMTPRCFIWKLEKCTFRHLSELRYLRQLKGELVEKMRGLILGMWSLRNLLDIQELDQSHPKRQISLFSRFSLFPSYCSSLCPS